MKLWLVIASLMAFSSAAHAQQKIRVKKVKGNSALIESIGGQLTPGMTYDLISPEDMGGDEYSSNNRRYSVGLNFFMNNVKSDASGAVNVTNIDTSLRFGWNFGSIEIGPQVSYSTTIASVTSTTYKIGAFADYNIIPNIPGEAFLYGLGVVGAFGQHDPGGNDVNGDLKYDLMDAFVGPFIKWFPTGGPYGFRLDVGYLYERQNTTTQGTLTVTGFSSSAGIFAYF